MAASLIVRDIDEDLVRKLKLRAVRHGRSADAELCEILRQALAEEVEDFREMARRLRAATADRQHTSAADLLHEVREDR